MLDLFEKTSGTFGAWRDRWEARPKRAWEWWRTDPTEWHWHDPRRPAYAENGKPLIGIRVQRRWNGEQWEYRVPAGRLDAALAGNDNRALLAKAGGSNQKSRKRRRSGRPDKQR
jgi:hypothetical protein